MCRTIMIHAVLTLFAQCLIRSSVLLRVAGMCSVAFTVDTSLQSYHLVLDLFTG